MITLRLIVANLAALDLEFTGYDMPNPQSTLAMPISKPQFWHFYAPSYYCLWQCWRAQEHTCIGPPIPTNYHAKRRMPSYRPKPQSDLWWDVKQCHIQGLSGPPTETKAVSAAGPFQHPSGGKQFTVDKAVSAAFFVASSSFQIQPCDVWSGLGQTHLGRGITKRW
jgi:hypothetical protein